MQKKKEAFYSCSQPSVFAQTQALRDSITRAEIIIITCLQTVHTRGSLRSVDKSGGCLPCHVPR